MPENVEFDRSQMPTTVQDFQINLGTSTLPRFSCACHKLNLVIRHAIEKNAEIQSVVLQLNRANDHIRRTVCLATLFREKKCLLRLDNLTRWSSVFLMLQSVKRAYDELELCFI